MKKVIIRKQSEALPLIVTCPSCGRECDGTDDLVGHEVECPVCAHCFTVGGGPAKHNNKSLSEADLLRKLIAVAQQQADDIHQIRNAIAAVLILVLVGILGSILAAALL